MKYIWEELIVLIKKFYDDLEPTFAAGAIPFSYTAVFGFYHLISKNIGGSSFTFYLTIGCWIMGAIINWISSPKRSKVEVSMSITLTILSFTIWYFIIIVWLYLGIKYIIVAVINIPKKYKDLPDI